MGVGPAVYAEFCVESFRLADMKAKVFYVDANVRKHFISLLLVFSPSHSGDRRRRKNGRVKKGEVLLLKPSVFDSTFHLSTKW